MDDEIDETSDAEEIQQMIEILRSKIMFTVPKNGILRKWD